MYRYKDSMWWKILKTKPGLDERLEKEKNASEVKWPPSRRKFWSERHQRRGQVRWDRRSDTPIPVDDDDGRAKSGTAPYHDREVSRCRQRAWTSSTEGSVRVLLADQAPMWLVYSTRSIIQVPSILMWSVIHIATSRDHLFFIFQVVQ